MPSRPCRYQQKEEIFVNSIFDAKRFGLSTVIVVLISASGARAGEVNDDIKAGMKNAVAILDDSTAPDLNRRLDSALAGLDKATSSLRAMTLRDQANLIVAGHPNDDLSVGRFYERRSGSLTFDLYHSLTSRLLQNWGYDENGEFRNLGRTKPVNSNAAKLARRGTELYSILAGDSVNNMGVRGDFIFWLAHGIKSFRKASDDFIKACGNGTGQNLNNITQIQDAISQSKQASNDLAWLVDYIATKKTSTVKSVQDFKPAFNGFYQQVIDMIQSGELARSIESDDRNEVEEFVSTVSARAVALAKLQRRMELNFSRDLAAMEPAYDEARNAYEGLVKQGCPSGAEKKSVSSSSSKSGTPANAVQTARQGGAAALSAQ
jgi:hypothetical protein